jgi:hypothetical protein
MNKFAGFVIALLAVVVGLCALYPGVYVPMPTTSERCRLPLQLK